MSCTGDAAGAEFAPGLAPQSEPIGSLISATALDTSFSRAMANVNAVLREEVIVDDRDRPTSHRSIVRIVEMECVRSRS